MIVHPKNWAEVGQPILIEQIEERIIQTLTEINCRCLSFSGGLDSSLMLYFMATVFDKVTAFTIGFPETHPDIEYSRLVAKTFGNVEHKICVPSADEVAEEKGEKPGSDVGVRLFYKFLAERKIPGIIACDGIDEYMAGYYAHQATDDELGRLRCIETYYKYIHRLRDEHLKPLNENSGNIKVYLPYLDNRLLCLLAQIPIADKVDSKNRKKVMARMAEHRLPRKVVERWKYGFCDALGIKKARYCIESTA